VKEVDATITVNSSPLDPYLVALPVTIRHGRSEVATQPDAPDLAFTWLDQTPPGQIGDDIRLDLAAPTEPGGVGTWDDPRLQWEDRSWSWDGTRQPVPRFVGELTGLTARELEGQVQAWDVTAVGVQSRYGRRFVNTDRPTEPDTTRILNLTVPQLPPAHVVGPPGVTFTAHTYTHETLLTALQTIATQAGGLVWQDRAGRLCYGSMYHRDQQPPRAVLPADVIVDGLSWVQDFAAIINSATVTYGPQDAQATTNPIEDTASISAYGTMAAQVDTMLATAPDATTLGALIIARRAQPWWQLTGLTVPLHQADPTMVRDLLDLEVGDAVYIPVPAAPGPAPTDLVDWTVEGWTETWSAGGEHVLTLALVDRRRWGTAGVTSWAEARDAGPWAYWQPKTWLDQLTEEVGAP